MFSDKFALPPPDEAPALARLEAFLEESRKELAFPEWIETLLERDYGLRMSRWFAKDAVKTVVFYNIFLVGDVLLTPDALRVAVALHALVSAIMLVIALRFRHGLNRLQRDVASAAVPTLIVAQILAVYAASRSETAALYLYFVTMTSICANIALRLSYRAARWATVATVAMLTATLALTQREPFGVSSMLVLTLAVCAHVSLNGNFGRERDFRRFYLHRLRDRQRVAAVDREARRDALTGLANRRRLDEGAAALWKLGDAGASPVSAILFDVDRFKFYNDLYGHQAGDACLKRVADCVARHVSRSDEIAVRYGGEEFLWLLPRTGSGEAYRLAERLREAIAEMGIPHEAGEAMGIVTASFGVATVEVSSAPFEALVAGADEALYVAKREGRNCVRHPAVFEPGPAPKAQAA